MSYGFRGQEVKGQGHDAMMLGAVKVKVNREGKTQRPITIEKVLCIFSPDLAKSKCVPSIKCMF